jgi:hypothetical protein
MLATTAALLASRARRAAARIAKSRGIAPQTVFNARRNRRHSEHRDLHYALWDARQKGN